MPRTSVAVPLAAALTLATLAAPATARPAARERVATVEYTSAGGVAGIISGDTDVNGTHYGSARVFVRRGESRVTLTVTDDGGLPVAFEVSQAGRDLGAFCGRTDTLRLKGRDDVVVYVLAGQCGSGVSAPTTGTVTARLA